MKKSGHEEILSPPAFFRPLYGNMINHRIMSALETSDSDLVAQSLRGSREAFRQIVERYQTLVCSLAYSATGNVSQSQDMAQETFIAAWQGLPALREPEKLRAWLCRIIRNRINKRFHREYADPITHAAPLEEFHEVPATGALPSEQTISREEEAILWRALEKIPETYREPLVLFYREHQSIERVAAALELSEDAVRQRLTRGRKMLEEEVQAFVEKTLVRTAPGQQFSGAILAALPLGSGSAATVGASAGAKGAVAAKTGFLALSFAALAPFIGILTGFITQWTVIHATTTGQNRRKKLIELVAFWIFIPGIAVAGEYSVYALQQHFGWDSHDFFIARTVFWWLYTCLLSTFLVSMYRRALAINGPATLPIDRPLPPPESYSPFHAIMTSAGMHAAMFLWFVALVWRMGDPLTASLVTGIVVLLAVGQFFYNRGLAGVAAVRANFGYAALCSAFIVLVINLRLDTWLATVRGISVAAIHQLYPLWMIPLLTAALALYIVLLVRLIGTRPIHQNT
jgi:RNA polymerase sigma factor (sigma-70 family)